MKSSRQRPGGPGLTASNSPDFANVWRDTSRRVTGFLRRMGASRELADDLVQDVALRMLRADVTFAEPEDLRKWSYVVARRLYVDHARRPRPVTCDPRELPDEVSSTDVLRTVESRQALVQAARLLRTMSEADQEALRVLIQDEPGPAPSSRRESTRLAVQRHRARNRLEQLIAATAALLGVLVARLRRIGTSAMTTAASAIPLFAMALVPLHESAASPTPLPAQAVVITSAPTAQEGSARLATKERTLQGPTPAHARTQRDATTAHEDTRVDTPVPGLRARSGTTSNPDNHLACLGVGVGLDDLCVDRPRLEAVIATPGGSGPAAP